MTTLRRHIFLLSIILVATSFITKDLNEYGKWLRFHGLTGEDFKQVGSDKPEKFEYKFSSLLYDTLSLYPSPDSTHILDLNSLYYDNDSNLDVDPHFRTVQMVRVKDTLASTLLILHIDKGYTEATIWRTEDRFEILGFTIEDKKFIPTIWKYDLRYNFSQKFESTKTFKTRPNSYISEIRMRACKQK